MEALTRMLRAVPGTMFKSRPSLARMNREFADLSKGHGDAERHGKRVAEDADDDESGDRLADEG